jgi:hypothetical protein
MRKDVAAASFVHVKADHLPADGTLRHQRMKPLAPEQLEEFDNPYGYVPHIRFPSQFGASAAHFCV